MTECPCREWRLQLCMRLIVRDGDLLDQDVDAIVNPWNRNLFPWWLLLPQGVSGAIKRRAGLGPFRELRRYGLLPLGAAVLTSSGRLPYKAIIHVAGIGLLWRASERSVELSVRSAIALAVEQGFLSVALSLIGAGTGGLRPKIVERLVLEALNDCHFDGEVRLVRYSRAS
jgi:O-acetyl-ADP-ribose deacetylase